MKKITYTIAALTTSFSLSQAAFVTGITTTEGFVSGGGGAQTLTSYTDNTGTYGDLIFASGKEGDLGNGARMWGEGGTDAGSDLAALTGGRIDTGTVATGAGVPTAGQRFTFTQNLTNTQQFVIFFNTELTTSFLFDVALYDVSGNQLGSTVDLTTATNPNVAVNSFGTLDLSRVGGANNSVLNNRAMYGYTVNIADFNLTAGQTSSIQGISFGAPTTGVNFHGVAAAVPEASTYALLAGLSALGSIGMRRRR